MLAFEKVGPAEPSAAQDATAEDAPPTPVAHVRLLDYEGDERLEVVSIDMRHCVIMSGRN